MNSTLTLSPGGSLHCPALHRSIPLHAGVQAASAPGPRQLAMTSTRTLDTIIVLHCSLKCTCKGAQAHAQAQGCCAGGTRARSQPAFWGRLQRAPYLEWLCQAGRPLRGARVSTLPLPSPYTQYIPCQEERRQTKVKDRVSCQLLHDWYRGRGSVTCKALGAPPCQGTIEPNPGF